MEPAHTGDCTNIAGSLALSCNSIGGKSVTLGGAFTTTGAYAFGLWADSFRGLQFRPANASPSAYQYSWADSSGSDQWGMDGSFNFVPNTDNAVGLGTSSNNAKGVYAYTVYTKPVAVASLPTCNSAAKGAIASVSDGTAALAWGATVTGGASTYYLVTCNGSNWTVAGK